MRFRIWLENMQSDKDERLQRIWSDTFKALGVGGLSDEDAAQNSLSKITFGARGGKGNNFKGKQAVAKRLENGQIFSALEQLGDPEIKKNVEAVRKWLGTQEPEMVSNASTTVSQLLQRLFGKETFEKFIDSDFPKTDDAEAQVEPQPPKQQGAGGEGPQDPTGMDQQTPQPGGPTPGGPDMMGQQPQASGAMMPPQPNNGMPPKPAGAEMGLF